MIELPATLTVGATPAPAAPIQLRNGWAAIFRGGGVGDDLMCASPLPLLREKFGHVEVITQQPQGVVFQNNPHVDKLSFIDPSTLPQDSSGNWQNYWANRAKEYDAFFNLSHSCETTRALFVGQTHFHWPASFRRSFCHQNYLETIHDICEVPHQFAPLFYPTDAEREQAIATKRKVGERCVIWVISGTRLDKLHPYGSVAIAQIIREVGPVIMLGAPGKDFELAKAAQQDVIRFNGKDSGLHLGLSPDPANPTWGIRRVLTQALYGDVVISPDTGPAWACAFDAVPQIVLLSHASAENITKHWRNTVSLHANPARVPCSPCHQLHDTVQFCTPNRDKNGAACISDIEVQTIVRETKQLWDGTGSYGVKMQA